MSQHGFTYEATTEDSSCPFCGQFIPKGASTCGSCQATHGSQITMGGFTTMIFLFLVAVIFLFLVAVYSLSMLAVFESTIVGVIAGAAIALGSFYLFSLFVAKFKTTKGWFR
ncbi:hypothetical protein [Pseudodesulfovibrio piezophilus]|uniref:Uncharacterized protein n=1 Tax=Pseudodesulfovibrio piezophilus (strain DSM 21447 / JCM 15486 / C1TLV30) TaxID=1322246 RepID=M1WJU8_PSEP2|nr:hypothetical protein [Pseudodesulfovibrio piezophilus]CCH48521.1 protein of unknown function [Pseudodesulfovibrio piezophilus C1TLV30]